MLKCCWQNSAIRCSLVSASSTSIAGACSCSCTASSSSLTKADYSIASLSSCLSGDSAPTLRPRLTLSLRLTLRTRLTLKTALTLLCRR